MQLFKELVTSCEEKLLYSLIRFQSQTTISAQGQSIKTTKVDLLILRFDNDFQTENEEL